jgi:ribulose-phosphate 3-epimerase
MSMIAPSILSANFGRLTEEIHAIESAGADFVHVDVMDGRFVPNITIGPLVVQAVKKATKLPLDVHLMIVEPEKYISAFASAGAARISVHAEACSHLHRTLGQIRETGAMPGVAINPATPLCQVEEILDQVGMVLIMSDKIRRLKNMVQGRNLSVDIEVDGGIQAETAAMAREAGANILVAGSAVFNSSDYRLAISALRVNPKYQ